VVDIPQGAWYEPDENGVDRGGCVNVLTSHHWTPFAFSNTQQTMMVQVEKVIKDGSWVMDPGLSSSLHDPSSILHRRRRK
jgi:hypothetical protein